MRRHPALENGESQFAFIGGEVLLLRSVNGIGGRSRIGEIVAMTMSVTMPTGVPDFAQRAKRDPAAETDESDTGCSIDDPAEACGEGNPGEPHNSSDQQGRHHVAKAGLQ
jgi:hypothetical protein